MNFLNSNFDKNPFSLILKEFYFNIDVQCFNYALFYKCNDLVFE